MGSSTLEVDEIKRKILPILRRHGDIDILVEVGSDMSLLDFVGLKLEVEEALGRKVDLVEYSTIKPLLEERILNEQVVIL